MPALQGTKHHAAKMTVAKVRAARKTFESGQYVLIEGKRLPVTVAALARKYGVAHQTMHAILNRTTWKHVTP